MSTKPFTSAVASLLIIIFLVPSVLFVAPHLAHAQEYEPVAVPTQGVGLNDFISTVKGILTQVNTFTTAAATYASYINTYILQPIAFVMSGQLMKALTASVMKYVIGKANGTGVPQFTVDIQKSLRSISDFQKNAYLRQVSLTNSPFATSIAQALDIDYNQSTSLAGFWAQNQCTLGQNIPTYQPGYLAGNWSEGGTAAWFQLTTQTQNNPYILYQSSAAQLSKMTSSGITGGPSARVQELSWGQGFMSWCGTSDSATQTQNAASSGYQACIAQCNNVGYTDTCANSCGANFATDGGIIAGGGINPGDPCTNLDTGAAGTIQTPGSTIKATLDKVLGSQQDRLVQMGNISTQVNSILGNIGTVLNTINLAANILGGGDTGSGGLLGAGQPSGALTKFNAPNSTASSSLTTGYGTSVSQINGAAAASAVTAATQQSTSTNLTPADLGLTGGTANGGSTPADMNTRIQQYKVAWGTISSAATTASSSLQTMIYTCHTNLNGSSPYETSAQNALSTEVAPVFTQVANSTAITDAAMIQLYAVLNEPKTSSTYTTDLQKLNSMPPTASDVATAQYNATSYGAAVATPKGSLTVSGSSIVDQMNLLSANASGIQNTACYVQRN